MTRFWLVSRERSNILLLFLVQIISSPLGESLRVASPTLKGMYWSQNIHPCDTLPCGDYSWVAWMPYGQNPGGVGKPSPSPVGATYVEEDMSNALIAASRAASRKAVWFDSTSLKPTWLIIRRKFLIGDVGVANITSKTP